MTVTWNNGGARTVGVNYTYANNCTAAFATIKKVNVNPLLTLANSISTAQTTICAGTPATITSNSNHPVSACDWYVNGVIVSHATSGTITFTVAPLPPLTQTLTGITVANGQTVCYDAVQTITVGGTGPFLVSNGGTANLIAGQKIRVLPGSKVEHGGYFHGFISDNCLLGNTYSRNPVVSSKPVEKEGKIPTEPSLVKSANNFFSVYPNPTNGAFTLELSEVSKNAVVNVEIYGIYGEKLLSDRFMGEKKHWFTLERQPAGVYSIRVSCGANLGSQMIIRK